MRLRDDEGHAAARLAADRVGAVVGLGGDVVALAHGTLGAVDYDLSGGHDIEGRCEREWRMREEDMASDDAGMMTGAVINFDQSVWGAYSSDPPTPETPLSL